ncbi:hypothetical protein T492DRAFT_437312 [Pavlovales sp. CCMP2436]|nr:hypothetical protein T492DRAFT_437312 [Pavlovales sp. CCMP2436]
MYVCVCVYLFIFFNELTRNKLYILCSIRPPSAAREHPPPTPFRRTPPLPLATLRTLHGNRPPPKILPRNLPACPPASRGRLRPRGGRCLRRSPGRCARSEQGGSCRMNENVFDKNSREAPGQKSCSPFPPWRKPATPPWSCRRSRSKTAGPRAPRERLPPPPSDYSP